MASALALGARGRGFESHHSDHPSSALGGLRMAFGHLFFTCLHVFLSFTKGEAGDSGFKSWISDQFNIYVLKSPTQSDWVGLLV